MAQQTLLLVDDEPNILNALKRLLRRDGYSILTANGGQQAFGLLATHEVGVIVSDQRMPGMSGTDFLRQARVQYPETVRIVLSGYTELDSVTRAVNEGAIYKFLTKPWEEPQLRAAVKEAFEHFELKQENQRLTEQLRDANAELTKLSREAQDAFQELFQRSNDAILVVNGDGRVDFVNPAAEILLGRRAGQLINHPLGLPIDESGYSEVQVQRPDGSQVLAQMRGARIERSSEPATLITLHDVTDERRVIEERRDNARRIQKALLQTIQAVSVTVEKRDPFTSGHQARVADLSVALARELGLNPFRQQGLRMGALIHDIGKIYVPAEILNRPGGLSEVEFAIVQAHPKVGHDIVSKVDFPWPVADMVLQHHERLNGSGYPHGITGERMILESRILAVADVVESMLSHRPFRSAHPLARVMEELTRGAGLRFDTDVVRACRRLFLKQDYQLPEPKTCGFDSELYFEDDEQSEEMHGIA